MMRITENISLLPFNTFGMDVRARYFTGVEVKEDLRALMDEPLFRSAPRFILGGGSNILFTRDFEGLVIHSLLKGIRVVDEDKDFLLLEAGAGERWHDVVMHCVAHDWGGLENLSLIPGTCGAAPIQNIGAYGVELKELVHEVHGVDLQTGAEVTFNNADCRFSYRESVFKQDKKEKIFISSITLRLTRKNHQLHTQYGALREQLNARHIDHPTIQDVSDAVIAIRQRKLPDPARIGNAGSFFKNPTVSSVAFAALQKAFPSIPSYPIDNQNVKIPAGWLIEQCGWKGKRFGNVGVHPDQALVLVHYGGGSGEEIFQLATKIQTSVLEKFDVTLVREVNVL